MKSRLMGLALLVGVSANASAVSTSYSFTGTFGADDDVQLFKFTADGLSTVTLRSYSYAGGIQANGNVVAAGGFDPMLALFDSAGIYINDNDDGTGVPADPITGRAFDTELNIILAAGDYTVAIMQYDNFANGPTLSDGFAQTGDPFFTRFTGCSNGQFCEDSNNNRTNAWAFDIHNVETALTVVPVPAAGWLFGSGMLGFIGVARRKTAL